MSGKEDFVLDVIRCLRFICCAQYFGSGAESTNTVHLFIFLNGYM